MLAQLLKECLAGSIASYAVRRLAGEAPLEKGGLHHKELVQKLVVRILRSRCRLLAYPRQKFCK